MASNGKQLAALAVFRSLYDNRKDIFTIICEFIKDVIYSHKLYTFNVTQITDLLKNDFDFRIPEAVVTTALNRIAQKDKGQYSIPDIGTMRDSVVSTQYKAIQADNNTIIRDLIIFVEQETGELLNDAQKTILYQSLCAYLIEDDTDAEYSEYISAFIIKGQMDDQFTRRLNTIKEGVVLYSGLLYNDNLNEIGTWTTPLDIYVEQEILFHFAGYNGELYQNLFEDFYKLIKEINLKSKQKSNRSLIRIKYFPEIREEVDRFFKKAEQIIDGEDIQDSSKTAMLSILSGCSSAADVVQKRAEFYTLLQTNSIVEEEEYDYYSERNQEYNIESKELLSALSAKLTEDQVYPHLKYLNYINVLRRGNNTQRFENIRFILLSGNWRTIYMSLHSLIKENGNVPLATCLDFITSRFWFKLNKGFGDGNYPKSFDIVNKAQMVLSAHLNNSVAVEFNKIKEKINAGALSQDAALAALAELKSRVRKPEEIASENVDVVVKSIAESDIEKHLRERELERIKAKEQEKHNQELKQNLAQAKEELNQRDEIYQMTIADKDAMHKKELQQQQKEHLAAIKKQKEDELKTISIFIQKIGRRKDLADKKVNTRLRYYSCIPVLLLIGYFVLMAIGTCKYTWDIMEPITYFGGAAFTCFLYAYFAFKGSSWNPFTYLTNKCKPQLTHKFYQKFDVDISQLESLQKKKAELEISIKE